MKTRGVKSSKGKYVNKVQNTELNISTSKSAFYLLLLVRALALNISTIGLLSK